MGFDMYLRNKPLPEPEAPEGTPPWEREQPNYFRLNVWGMSRWVAAMDRLGMVDMDGDRTLGFPEVPAQYRDLDFEDYPPQLQEAIDRNLADHGTAGEGIPWWKFSSNDGWIVTPEECRQALAAFAAHTEGEVRATLLETTDPGPDGVRNKARLTAEMVITALGGLSATEDAEEGIDPEYWAQWLEFLRAGAAHDGFEVF